MRVLRNKHHRKYLNFYEVAFGIRAPYTVRARRAAGRGDAAATG